jgi:hypothetical protein
MVWVTSGDSFEMVGTCPVPYVGVAARVAAFRASEHGSGGRGCELASSAVYLSERRRRRR